MKQLAIFLFSMCSICMAYAQETQPNQNPNWKKSLEKYEANKEKLTETQGTTEQKTYKAYDWTEAKNERKQQRRDYRQQRALARINRPSIWSSNRMNFYDPTWYPGRNRFWVY